MELIFSLIILSILLAFIAIFLFKIVDGFYSFLFWGAIYVPTSEKRVEQMINLLDLHRISKAVDLGSGDGRFLVALAKKEVEAHGYEINPFLVSLAEKNIKEAGVEGKAFVYLRNLWKADLKDFDAVILYGMRHMMGKLEKKLQKELKPGAVVVSNYFVFPNWKTDRVEENIYLYVKK